MCEIPDVLLSIILELLYRLTHPKWVLNTIQLRLINKCLLDFFQIVLDDLSRAREGFVLASDLHLVYLVTPINVDVEPDWELYYERFMELSALDQVKFLAE